ncbi:MULTISPECIES: hypothetical protein [Streptomycetaceae]|uniref:Uncharacterized protein n=1 Tax=Streptantibioticus cattleyicolor (strain ATCC 35852 / DSM 46488 / JCM 4925 / NBRC 14057 / NRRL 8057) TaxID=1003195 RepID=F8JU39_STREN|nr:MULTISPECIES: hypothetical protein [Streptomycetaceae]AEW93051.1 hypothetical protein SCATT_06800 [Streptantibioticus cattleyicolor NRRL 8057 = DSM 46488]MYS57784.1 hypothetical protein [Streptomyces sp. SID5468]CCB73409.1 protein of unknown function [Streptantibioticus cattleyicolor NRRL 8057 = DSM 46488]
MSDIRTPRDTVAVEGFTRLPPAAAHEVIRVREPGFLAGELSAADTAGATAGDRTDSVTTVGHGTGPGVARPDPATAEPRAAEPAAPRALEAAGKDAR